MPGVLLGTLLVGALALSGCGGAAERQTGGDGCSEALAAREEALASVDVSTRQAVEKNPARAAQLQGIAKTAEGELAAAVDLGPCEDDSDATGLVVDLADLRVRYTVVLERTQAELDQTAAQPVPVRAPKEDTKKGPGGGTKGGTKGD